MSTQIGRPISDSTKRILEAAPALAKAGLTKSDAAREMGVLPPVFTSAVLRHLPDLQWRDGHEDRRGGRPLADQTKRILDAAPGLAARGLSKAEAARELGVSQAVISICAQRHLPEVEWRDGRVRAPSTFKED